jgi:hypothetical protein
MTQVYFHCSNTKKVFVDRRGAVVDNLAEARNHATRVVQSFTSKRSLKDWRDWVLHVSDDQGDELFVVPFILLLSEPELTSPRPGDPLGQSVHVRLREQAI